MNLYTEHSYWWLVLTGLIAFLYAALLYYKNKKEDFSKTKLIILSFFRFLSVFLISSLLISPIIKTTSSFIKKPHIVILQDDSESIVLTDDSLFMKTDYGIQLNDLIKSLSADYNVDLFSFGDDLKSGIEYEFKQKHTDLSNALGQIKEKYSYQNLGAIILASDGITNLGSDPYYSALDINSPIYSIALGDSSEKKDLRINRLIHNNLVYQNNKFPLKVDVISRSLKNEKYSCKVYFDGKLVDEKTLLIDSEFYNRGIDFLIDASESGLKKIEVNLEKLQGEFNYFNNSQIAYVDVIESKKRILIAYNSPHPDIASLKAAISSHENYTVESFQIDNIKKNLNAYNMVIAYQLPDNSNTSFNFANKLKNSDIPTLFILGSNVNINKFNQLQVGVSISSRQRNFNETSAIVNRSFYEFQFNDDFINRISDFPPLLSAYGKYNQSPGIETILFQKLGNIETEYPLISIGKYREKSVAFVFGEGLWKWRLFNYSEFNNHNLFNNLIEKIIQFLNIKQQKDRFQLNHKRKFDESEDLIFNAMFYDVAYEPITNAEISLEILDENEDSYQFNFSFKNNSYYANAGSLPPGKYSLIAETQYGKEKFSKKSEFVINEIKLEANQLKANHNLLFRISSQNEAKTFFPNQINEIEAQIRDNSEVVSLKFQREKFNKILDWEWLLFFILFLLSFEWFIRKFSGTY